MFDGYRQRGEAFAAAAHGAGAAPVDAAGGPA